MGLPPGTAALWSRPCGTTFQEGKLLTTYARIYGLHNLTGDCERLEDVIGLLYGAAEKLEEMLERGVELDPNCQPAEHAVLLVTEDEEVALKYDMEAWDDAMEPR
jgi:hypothetical protein